MLPFSMHPYSLRNLRTISTHGRAKRSHDQFTATLARSGHPVAQVKSILAQDALEFGCMKGAESYELSVQFESAAEQAYYERFAEQINVNSELGRYMSANTPAGQEPGVALIYLLAYQRYIHTRLSENCSKFTLYRLPEAGENAWNMIKVPYRQGLAKAIRRRYPTAIIANELIEGSLAA